MQINPNHLFEGAFPEQIKFIQDPERLKCLWCTRRAGKSMTAAVYLLYEALMNPGCNFLALGLTRESIKNILWKDCLRWLNNKFNLEATFNLTELSMTLPNGSIIRLTGVNDNENEGLKLLGAKYRLVILDEGSMYTVSLSNLIYGVLKPAMADVGGTIAMLGTSSNFAKGLFYDITTGKEKGWSLHTWSAFANPYMQERWAWELNEIKTKRPLYMETPQFRQWYLNEWVIESDKLCYKFNEKKNLFSNTPQASQAGWTYVLGIDLGWEDDTAFVLSAFHENLPELYIVHSYNKKHMTLPDVEAKINEYVRDYNPSRIIIDGSAKQAVETMRTRTAIPFEFADKLGKETFIELLNADLIGGRIKIHSSCKALIDEMMSLVWQTEGDRIKLPRKEHPSLPNHLCDALLYNWRMCYHYHSEPVAKVIPMYSNEWYQKQSESIWEREKEHLERQERQVGDWPSEEGWN